MRAADRGLSLVEVATRVNRTDRAVQMLCHRGLEKLRAALDSSSAFFEIRREREAGTVLMGIGDTR